MTRSRLTRCALLVLGGLAALVFAGCSGITSPASDVTDNSATLRATVGWSNGETISWWFEIRQPGATWSVVKFHGPLVVRNTARDVALSEPVNALTPGTTYEYRLCSYFITSGGKQVGGPENPICVDQENGAPSDHWSQFTTTGIAPDPPPQTTVTSNPSGTITVDTATFSFVSSEENSTFECQLDGADFVECASPQTYSGLANGRHSFRVRAIDEAGNPDPTPSSRVFWVSLPG